MNPGLNLQDYAKAAANVPSAVFGGSSMDELNQLQKALEAGSITGRETTGMGNASGAPLKVESLDKNLKHLTFNEEDIKLWKMIPKKAAYNTVEEYNQLVDYGQQRGGFYNEGELPNEEESQYMRKAQLVKFMGVVKSVTHPMTLVNTNVGNIIDREIKNGTLWILRQLNKSLYFGDESLVPQEFNGFIAQHQKNSGFTDLDSYFNSDVVIDCRGEQLQEKYIEDAANGIIQNFGLGNQLFAPPKVLSNFVKNFYGNKFIQPNSNQVAAGVMGQRVKEFESQFGNIGLNWDIFFNKKPSRKVVNGPTSQLAPNAPTLAAVTSVPTDASSRFVADDAGDYLYAVAAVNRYGETVIVPFATPLAVVSGGAVDVQVTDGGGINPATSYVVYRTKKGVTDTAAEFYPLFTISKQELINGYDGAAQGSLRDKNRWLPDTDQAILFQMNNEVIEFAQLAPLMKMDLALLAPSYRFMILLYGTPFLYAPKKMVRIVNIGEKL